MTVRGMLNAYTEGAQVVNGGPGDLLARGRTERHRRELLPPANRARCTSAGPGWTSSRAVISTRWARRVRARTRDCNERPDAVRVGTPTRRVLVQSLVHCRPGCVRLGRSWATHHRPAGLRPSVPTDLLWDRNEVSASGPAILEDAATGLARGPSRRRRASEGTTGGGAAVSPTTAPASSLVAEGVARGAPRLARTNTRHGRYAAFLLTGVRERPLLVDPANARHLL